MEPARRPPRIFTRPHPKKWQLWLVILPLVFIADTLMVAYLTTTYGGISSADSIDLLSANFLLLLVLLEILPVEREPNMEVLDTGDAFTIKVIHKTGEFRIRLLYAGAWNREGLNAKQAKDVKMNLILRNPFVPFDFMSALPWQEYGAEEIRLGVKVDPTSAQDVVDALNKTLFKRRKMDFDPSDGYMVVVAFGLSTTGGIYSATEGPIRLDAPLHRPNTEKKEAGSIISVPIVLRLTSPDLPVPPTSINFVIRGTSWEDATIVPVRLTATPTGVAVSTPVEVKGGGGPSA